MINPLDLTGQIFLITGASSGIGRETAVLLSQLGAKVVLNGRSEERLRDTLSSMDGEGHLIEPYDLEETESVDTWLQAVASRSGLLDGLVHSAGVHSVMPIRFHNAKKAESLIRMNVLSTMSLMKGFCRKDVHAKTASAVLIASVMGVVGQPGVSAYAASKGALIAMSKSFALELAKEDVRVNCVLPGIVQTEMTDRFGAVFNKEQLDAIEKMHPLGFGKPRDVAYAIAFLLSRAARWITGTPLIVDGGYTSH